jgi:hypothetical protein
MIERINWNAFTSHGGGGENATQKFNLKKSKHERRLMRVARLTIKRSTKGGRKRACEELNSISGLKFCCDSRLGEDLIESKPREMEVKTDA